MQISILTCGHWVQTHFSTADVAKVRHYHTSHLCTDREHGYQKTIDVVEVYHPSNGE